MSATAAAALLVVLLASPLVAGLAVRTRSFLTGRRGAPVIQPYYDVWKLCRKESVYSRSTTWVFRAGPVVMLVAVLLALLLVPLDGRSSALRFEADLVAFAGLLALGRFALVLAGLDTGSSFEGMGASRDVMVATFAEPALFLCLMALVLATGDTSLTGMLGAPLGAAWQSAAPSLMLVGISLFVLLLAENARVPVDDPATHLELTMIHEVIVLDHSGPALAMILYGSALKLSLFGALVVSVLVPRAASAVLQIAVLAAGLAGVAVAVGVVESVTARLRLNRVAHLLTGAAVLAAVATILLLR